MYIQYVYTICIYIYINYIYTNIFYIDSKYLSLFQYVVISTRWWGSSARQDTPSKVEKEAAAGGRSQLVPSVYWKSTKFRYR